MQVVKSIKQGRVYYVFATLLGVISTPFWFVLFFKWYNATSFLPLFSFTFLIWLIIFTGVHEGVHILTYKTLAPKSRIKMGLNLPYSVYVLPLDPVRKRDMIMVTISPLIVISLLGFLLSRIFPSFDNLLMGIAAFNGIGSIGDIIMTIILLFHWRKYTTVKDKKGGFDLLM